MQRGCLLMVALAVFASAEVRAQAVAMSESEFSGSEALIDFSGLTPPNPIGMLTATDGVRTADFNDQLTANTIGGANISSASVTIDLGSTANRIGFRVDLANSGLTDVNVNGVSFGVVGAGVFVGVEDSAGTTQVTITLTSTGDNTLSIDNFRFEAYPAMGTPIIGVSDVNFGDTEVGTKGQGVIVISNTGTADLSVMSFSDPGGEFVVVEPTTLPLVVPQGMTANVQVCYNPIDLGTDTAMVDIVSNDPVNGTVTSTLTGKGVQAIISVPDIDFMDVGIGNTATADLVITNGGNIDLVITNITDPGGEFSVSATSLTVAAGATDTSVKVTFTPTAEGVVTASLQIESNDASSPATVDLIGNGIGIPAILVTSTKSDGTNDASIAFDPRFIDAGPTTERLIIENTGTGTLLVTPELDGQAPENVPGPPFRMTDFFSGLPIAIPIPIAPNGVIELTVEYNPDAVQSDSAQIDLYHNDPAVASPVMVPVTGEGLAPLVPDSSVNPTVLNYAGSFLGSGKSRSVTIQSEGNGSLVITRLEITGSGGSSYSISGKPELPLTLPPNGSAEDSLNLVVVFRPNRVGTRVANLEIDTSGGNHVVSMTGFGILELKPEIDISPDPVDFGTAPIGEQAKRLVRISNVGTETLTVNSLDVQGSGAFSVDPSVTVPFDLAANGFRDVELTFAPEEVGDASATLAVGSNDEDSPVASVDLIGSGTPELQPDIALDGTIHALDFGQVQSGSTVTKTVSVRNAGFNVLVLDSIGLSAESSAGYVYDGPANATLIPNETRALEVTFAPGEAGPATGSLVIVSNDPDPEEQTIEISLFGIGTVEPVAKIDVDTDPALPYEQVEIGNPRTKTFHIHNVGTAPLQVVAIHLGENSSADFTLTDVPMVPLDIAPNAHRDVSVTYDPSDLGFDSGTVVVESLDGANPSVSVILTGVGVEAPVPAVEVDLEAVDLGDVMVGESASATVTVRSVGSASLNVSSIDFNEAGGGDFSLTAPMLPADLAPDGGELTFDVTFSPTVDGSAAASVVIETNDPANPAVVVAVSGNGVPVPTPQVGVEPADLDFGDVEIGVISPLELTVSNNGDADLVVDSVQVGSGSSPAFAVTGAPDETLLSFTATIDGEQADACNGTGSPATGTGTFTLDLDTGVVSYEINYEQELMLGAETAAHIHGPAESCANAAVLFDLPDTNPKVGTATLTADQQAELIDGLYYVNIHSDVHPGGEIRGQIELVPAEPVAVLVPGDSAVFEVTYSPTGEPGSDSGTVEITSNDPADPVLSVSLAGNGVEGQVMQIRVAPSSVDFGGTRLGTTATADVMIRNMGTANLDLSSVNLGNGSSGRFGIAAQPSDMTVEPGTEANVTVSYTPLSPIVDSGTLRVQSNDGRRPQVTVSLLGFGEGDAAPTFIRGDANLDSTVDISDPVTVLGYLFAGGKAPECPDAADANDDGTLDVSDPVWVMQQLFGGRDVQGTVLPTTCEADATADSLPTCNVPPGACN